MVVPLYADFCHVQGCERRVEMEVELLEASCLAVAKAGELLRIAVAELDLETAAVVLDYIGGGDLGVGGEINLASGAVFRVEKDNTHSPLQSRCVCLEGVVLAVFTRHFDFFHPVRVGFLDIDFPVVFLGGTSLARPFQPLDQIFN